MTKPELRKIYKFKRQEFSPVEVQNISLRILKNLKQMPAWHYSNFHIFVPIAHQNEINTFPIIDQLFQLNKNVIVPKIEYNEMLNCLIDENVEWATGKFDVPEPLNYQLIDSQKIDVVFLPMLICDKSGNRIGYGGGFYDRFLQGCRQDVVKIGLNFFSPVNEIPDVFESDVPLDYCVTGDEIVSFAS